MNTYVLDGIEVKMTGRTAIKKIGKEERSRSLTIYEVTPVDESSDWKKWVGMDALYTVKNDK